MLLRKCEKMQEHDTILKHFMFLQDLYIAVLCAKSNVSFHQNSKRTGKVFKQILVKVWMGGPQDAGQVYIYVRIFLYS